MDRRHLIIPAALLAGSALLGGRAIIQTMGPGAAAGEQAASSKLTRTVDDRAFADRSRSLDAMERRIATLAADTPPAVRPAPAMQARELRVSSGPSSRAAGAPQPMTQATTPGGHGADDAGDDREVEQRGGDDDGIDAADDRGGDDDRGSDDRDDDRGGDDD